MHPTLDTKRLILQMTVGAMTQFLTVAQGMPKSTLTTLTQTMCLFLWNGQKSSPISLHRLQKPRSEGGIALLDLKTRNLTIDTIWLKKYLDTSPLRPTWAFVTDTIINCIRPSGIQCLNNVNIFLTSLRPPTRPGPNNQSRRRPPPRIVTLFKTTKNANLALAPLKLS